jgi:hypothetical protein
MQKDVAMFDDNPLHWLPLVLAVGESIVYSPLMNIILSTGQRHACHV